MGNADFGQLAYDKRIVVFAATQTANQAWGLGNSIASEAIVNEGILRGLARGSTRPTMTDVLRYAEARVPALYRELFGGEARVRPTQSPRLFSFANPRGAQVPPLYLEP